jgi:branched-subunit amino acid aminotransferase/4-amino-4-deoxychorismate lyase
LLTIFTKKKCLLLSVLPKIQANYAGAADALMLDLDGFVSETNATNVFMIKHGVVYTPHADACLPGVTRETVMRIVPSLGLRMVERRLSLAEFHAADEVFTTGTMGELTPVYEIDGRNIGPSDGSPPPKVSITRKIQQAYTELTKTEGYPIPSV